MSCTIGLDLGTTSSAVAVIRNGRPRVLTKPAVESVVAFAGPGVTLTGGFAKRQALTDPYNTVFGVKRWLGRRFDSEIVRQSLALPNTLLEADNGDACLRIENDVYSPPAIAAEIVLSLRTDAEKALEEDIDRAVLTVPASFDDAGRRAMIDAGRIAGLEVVGLVNETSAIALAGQLLGTDAGLAAFYRLGGGSFDVSIVELRDGLCRVLAVSGDDQLGGDDFDQPIVDWLVEEFQADHGIDLRTDDVAMTRLRDAVQKTKHDLSVCRQSEIYLPIISAIRGRPLHLNKVLGRTSFEPMVRSLVQRTRQLSQRALNDAGLSASRLDRVFAVGDGTRMPLVKEAIHQVFGKVAQLDLITGETAAMGAAIRAALSNGNGDDVSSPSPEAAPPAEGDDTRRAGASGGLSLAEVEAARRKCIRRERPAIRPKGSLEPKTNPSIVADLSPPGSSSE